MTRRTPSPILLTGFAPFGGEAINPSWEAVRVLDGTFVGDRPIVARQLPVDFIQAPRVLDALIGTIDPALVLCVGQAGGRAQLSLERVAINVADARIPDNTGGAPIDVPLVDGGPVGYWSTLPIKAILAALRDAGLPAEISQTAGTYVCNAVFYALMHALRDRPQARGGFLHIPYSPEQAVRHPGAPSLPVDAVTSAITIAIDVALATSVDHRIASGAEH